MRSLIHKAKRLTAEARRRLAAGDRIFLTFDDGPLESFPGILDLLGEYDARATFFLVASRIDAGNMAQVRRALLAGHEIGNHSWSHRAFSEITEAEIEHQIVRAHEVIDRILRDTDGKGVQRPEQRYFRFPWLDSGVGYRSGKVVRGSLARRDAARRVLAGLGYRIVGIDLESRDWAIDFEQATVPEVAERLLGARRGDVILMHDRSGATDILERVLPALSQRWRLAPLSARTF